MPFTGFNIKYPEYEVICPQSLLSFTVRSLNVQEEEALKGSFITPIKITEHLNKAIFDSLVSKPASITDYNSFLANVTIRDRDALLYGLYHITYEEIRNYDIKCSECKKNYGVTVQASSTFNFNPYPDKDILKKRIKVPLKVMQGVTCVIRQPSLLDEINSLKSLSITNTTDVIIETLIIDRFEQQTESAEPIIYTDRGDIIDAFKTLPAKDKRLIFDSYTEELGKYGIELKMKSYCTHCGFEENITLDLVEQFFRMVYSA